MWDLFKITGYVCIILFMFSPYLIGLLIKSLNKKKGKIEEDEFSTMQAPFIRRGGRL